MERYTIMGRRGNTYATTARTAQQARRVARQLYVDGFQCVSIDYSPSADFAYDLRWTWYIDGEAYHNRKETWRQYTR